MTPPNEEQIAEALRIARENAARMLKGGALEGLSADDIAQDVIIRFLELDIEAVPNWRAWVKKATRNRSLDLIRAQERHLKALREQLPARIAQWVLGPSARVLDEDARRRVLAVLTPREQQILLLHSQGMSAEAIAEEFGYANGRSAAAAISRARGKVRDSFQDRGAVFEPQRPYGEQRVHGKKYRDYDEA